MRIPLIEGRTFASDDPPEVIVINEIVARRYWHNQSPVGSRFRLDPSWPWYTVIGVAKDVKGTGPEDAFGEGMEVYFPFVGARFASVIVRTSGDETRIVTELKRRLWQLDPDLPVLEASTMEQRLGDSVAKPRFFLSLCTVFASVALLLAGVGVYGTAAYWVAQRRRGLGIWVAVGASPRAVVGLVLRRSVRLAVWGSLLGLGLSLSLARVLRSLLFETDVHEPSVFVEVTGVLAVLVVIACYVPARRASRIDPQAVLRAE
jgi:putative ABC transport system permease protein